MKETSPGKFVLSHSNSHDGGTVFTNVPNTDATEKQSQNLAESLKNKEKNLSLNLEKNEDGKFSYKKKFKPSDIADIIQKKVNEMKDNAHSKEGNKEETVNNDVPYKEDVESKKKFIQKLLEMGKEKRRILIGEYRNPVSLDPRSHIKKSVLERFGLTEEQTNLMMKNGAFKKELEEITPKKFEEMISEENVRRNLIEHGGMSAEEADKLIQEGKKNRTAIKQVITEFISKN